MGSPPKRCTTAFELIELVTGVVPNLEVPTTVDDLRLGRDRALEVAVAHLKR